MARMVQSVPDKVDRPGRVMTRDYDNRSRIPSSARCTSSPPLPLALPFDRGPYSPPRYLSYPLFRFFHLFTSLASLSSTVHPLPLSSSRAFRVSSSLLCDACVFRILSEHSFIIFYFIHIPRILGVHIFYLVLAYEALAILSTSAYCM